MIEFNSKKNGIDEEQKQLLKEEKEHQKIIKDCTALICEYEVVHLLFDYPKEFANGFALKAIVDEETLSNIKERVAKEALWNEALEIRKEYIQCKEENSFLRLQSIYDNVYGKTISEEELKGAGYDFADIVCYLLDAVYSKCGYCDGVLLRSDEDIVVNIHDKYHVTKSLYQEWKKEKIESQKAVENIRREKVQLAKREGYYNYAYSIRQGMTLFVVICAILVIGPLILVPYNTDNYCQYLRIKAGL